MTDDFKLDSDEFFNAALELIPLATSIKQVGSTADTDSAGKGTPWGNDDFGAGFEGEYLRLRSEILRDTGTVATNIDSLRTSYIDARDELVQTDEESGELVAITGREIDLGDGEKTTLEAGVPLTFGETDTAPETPEEIAANLTSLDEAHEDAEEKAKDAYS